MPEPLTPTDIADINRQVALYGHIVDARDWPRMRELFTDNLVFVPFQSDMQELTSLDQLIELWSGAGFPHPSGHHATNVLVDPVEDGIATATWKGISVHRNGQARSLIYTERLRRTADGWRGYWLRVEQRPTHVDPVRASA